MAKKMHTTAPIKDKGAELFAPIKLSVGLGRVGHQQHTGGTGFHNSRKRAGNRSQQTRKAVAEYA
jgi:hypothetical protein